MQRKLLTYLVIIALALLCALNYQLFIFPNRFAPAGFWNRVLFQSLRRIADDHHHTHDDHCGGWRSW